MLEVLRDGDWHSTRQLQDAGGGLRIPSRVDELRKIGFSIECRRIGPLWRYRLVRASRARAHGMQASKDRGSTPLLCKASTPHPIDECVGCGRRRELVDPDALYCESCFKLAIEEESAAARPDGQLVFLDRSMRKAPAS